MALSFEKDIECVRRLMIMELLLKPIWSSVDSFIAVALATGVKKIIMQYINIVVE